MPTQNLKIQAPAYDIIQIEAKGCGSVAGNVEMPTGANQAQ